RSQNNDVKRISHTAVAQYMYSIDKLSAEDMVQRMHPNAKILGTSTVTRGGTSQIVVNYLLNGTRQTYTIASKSSMASAAKTELGTQTYEVLQDLFSSGSLNEFAAKYANRSLDDKIYAAAVLAQAAHAGYSTVLEFASPFSTLRQRLAQLDPDTEFAKLQR